MLNCYLQFGKAPQPMQTVKADAVKLTETPRNNSASGYGSKLPTRYMIQHNNRWRRVYAICWSNCATHYILIQGELIIVNFYDEG